MEEIVYSLNLDLRKNTHQVLVMKEGDVNSRVIEAVITDNGKPYDLTNCAVNLKWKKPDKCIVYADTESVDSNTVRAVCSEQMLAVAGIAEAEFEIVSADTTVSTLKFTVSINKTVVSDEDIISSDEFSALQDVLVQSSEIKSHIEDESIHKEYIDVNYHRAIQTSTSALTERAIYNGLPIINGSHYYGSGTDIYAPYSVGTSGYTLHATGSGAPEWINVGEVISATYGEFKSGSDVLTWLEAGYTLTSGTWIIITQMYMSGGEPGLYEVKINDVTNGGMLNNSSMYINKPSEVGTRYTSEWTVVCEIENSCFLYPVCVNRPNTGTSSYYYSFITKAIRIK